MSKRVLVTGGAGFISSNFVRHLLAETPYEVVSLDALTYAGNLENLADVMSHERLSFVHGDIRDAELVREVVAEVDVIVNAAAESHVEKSIERGRLRVRHDERRGHADPARRDPRDAGRALHPHLVERGVRHRRARADGRGAPARTRAARTPRRRRAPTGSPTRTGSTYELPIVIVRPFNNYGPRQHPEKVVPRFITQALSDEPLTIHGDGHASRDWLYVDDDAEAIEAIIDAPIDRVAGEVLNVATGIDISVERRSPTPCSTCSASRARSRRTWTSGSARSTATSARPTRCERLTGWRARTIVRATASSAPSRGTARTRRGGGRVRRARTKRLLVLGAGPAQLGLLAAARRARPAT